MDNQDLTVRLQAGEIAALATLFENEHERLCRIVRFRMHRHLVGRVDPEDVVQEAYLDATTRLPHFDGEMSSFLWVRWVVHQTLIAVHRRHLGAKMRSAHRDQSIAGPATSFSLAQQLVDTPTTPSEAAIRDELTEMVARAIDGMSENDQEIIAMRHFEDLKNHEVAEVLKITPKTASIRYIRALTRLRRMLNASSVNSANWMPLGKKEDSSSSTSAL